MGSNTSSSSNARPNTCFAKTKPLRNYLRIEVAPKPGPHQEEFDWMALMVVRVDSLPRLFRKGFFWSPANLLPGKGYMGDSTNAPNTKERFQLCRHYFLQDLPRTKWTPGRWTMEIELFSNSKAFISRFRLEDLETELILRAWGFDESGKIVYEYDNKAPQDTINCIYDDMPLRGFFPQPTSTAKEGGGKVDAVQHIEKAQS